jgi:hypothetical protein
MRTAATSTAAKKQTGSDDGDAWVSLYTATELLGESRHKVLRLIITGELEGKVVAGRTIVLRESVARRKARLRAT